jgi:hypothetical protein
VTKHKPKPLVKRNKAGETMVYDKILGNWYLKTKVLRGVVKIQINGRWVPYH